MPVSHFFFFNYCSFVISFEIRNYESSTLFSLAIQGTLNFKIRFSIFEKKNHWDFDKDFTEAADHFE